MRHMRLKLWLRLGWIGILISACGLSDDAQPTATPERFSEYTALFVTEESENAQLTVTLDTLTANADDIQIIAVLADGNGSISYLAYPDNQPGTPQNPIDLSEFPLRTTSDVARLWVIAVQHQAYPIVDVPSVTADLAQGFNALYSATPSLADIVAAGDDSLVEWFGSVEIIGEIMLDIPQNSGQVLSASLSLDYDVERQPETTPIVAAPDDFYAGFRQVIDEDFANNAPSFAWFSDTATTYTVEVANDAYLITLTGLEPLRDNTSLSWGSLQNLVFEDYIVQAELSIDPLGRGASTGLWLNYQDPFNFLSFGIEDIGRYRVARFQRNNTEFVPWTPDPIINVDGRSNTLEVRLENDNYTVRINGKTVSNITDGIIERGRIAFYCFAEEVPVTCTLDRLQVWVPTDTPFPQTASDFAEP